MIWLAILSQAVSIVGLAVAAVLWRRVRRLERTGLLEPKNPPDRTPSDLSTMELTLEGMLEELENKCQEALKRIDRREAEVREGLMLLAAHAREVKASAPPAPEPSGRAGAPTPAREEAARDTRKEKTQAILRLANDGLDVVAIAQRLGLGKGEVQLVLDLHKQRGER